MATSLKQYTNFIDGSLAEPARETPTTSSTQPLGM